MIPLFQPSPTPASKAAKLHLEDAFAFLLQHANETDFNRLFEALCELQRVDPMLYRSLRAHFLTQSIFNTMADEDRHRRSYTMSWGAE